MSERDDAAASIAPSSKPALADTFADAVIAAEIHARLFAEVVAPVSIGRFRVTRALGSGAMGTVWLARDDELHRDVAIKVLRSPLARDAAQRARVMTEARSLARLSHPHVVVVHEVGSTERGLFVAMEYVRGMTLAQWQRAAARTTAEILRAYLQAGRGLAAAHHVGVVHRDFKPDNVLVGDDGRPRVADFGLARAELDADDRGSAADSEAGVDLTQTGALLGTPAYMAPEQLEGGPIDARSDQFAFAVALFEALHGQRPYAGETIAELRQSLRQGTLVARTRRVPGRVARAVERALAREPSARWPDLDALLAELERAIRPGRGWWIAASAGVVLASGIGIALARRDPCAQAAASEAAIWSPAARDASQRAFLGTEVPYAEAAWVSAAASLDAWAERLGESARTACASARVLDDPSFDAASAACLSDMRDELTALVDDLQHADGTVIATAPHRASAMPDPTACADARRARLVGAVQGSDRQAVLEANTAINRARHGHAALTYGPHEGFAAALRDALADAEQAADLAEGVGAGLQAAVARTLQSRLLVRRGDVQAAESAALRAVASATQIDDPVLRAVATIQLVYVVGQDNHRLDRARSLAEQAASLLSAAGDRPLLRAQLDNSLGTAESRDRAHTKDGTAIEHHRRALALFREHLGDAHPDTLAARVNVGGALNRADRAREALDELAPAVAPALATWGEHHPSVSRMYGVIGNSWLRLDDLDEAERWMRRALATAELAYDEHDAELANALYNLAQVLRRRLPDEVVAPLEGPMHELALETIALLERALALRERAEDAAGSGPFLIALGETEVLIGRHEQAEANLRRAIARFEGTGAIPLDFARARLALARALALRNPLEARVLAGAARDAYAEAGRIEVRDACDRLLARLAP